MEIKYNENDSLQRIIDIGRSLGGIQDIDVLLERILTETRKLVNADAGSIYIADLDAKTLSIKYGQNETHSKALAPGDKLPYTYFSFPINEKSICGYVALTGSTLNIADAYEISPDLPYKFNPNTDLTTGYRTKSICTFPLNMPGGKLLGVLQIINAKNSNEEIVPFDNNAVQLIENFASNAAHALQHAYFTNNMAKRMLRMAEFRDPKETYMHVERVSLFALEIYDRWAFNHKIPLEEVEKYRDSLKIAAKFHDVGKVGISDVILKKVYPAFTPEERTIMKGHTCIGAQLFEPPESDLDKICQEVALHHHDRWDGGPEGYPGKIDINHFSLLNGIIPVAEPLSGYEIPLAARIVAVADVFDALSHKRCYKKAWTEEQSFEEIKKNSGLQFDPEVVEAFFQVKHRISAIQKAMVDDAESL